jgi:hypothetical protein
VLPGEKLTAKATTEKSPTAVEAKAEAVKAQAER